MFAYLIPRLWPIDQGGGVAWNIAGVALLTLGLVLVAWRSMPAITGRGWRPHRRDPAHLRSTGQRVSDIVGPLSLVLIGIGALQRDWAWYAAGVALALVWCATMLSIGFAREHADPDLPKTTKQLVEPVPEPEELP